MKELILLTGCQHTGHPSDASPWDVARALHGKVVETYPIASVMLPRSLDAAIKAMAELLAVYEPRFSLCLGPFAEGGAHADSARRRQCCGHSWRQLLSVTCRNLRLESCRPPVRHELPVQPADQPTKSRAKWWLAARTAPTTGRATPCIA